MNGRDVRVFVVWEPVLATDFGAPSTASLARVSDKRAVQYWDRNRALSHLMGERDRASVVWDYIAVFPPGAVWQEDAPPRSVFSDHPVRKVIGRAKDAIERLTASGGSSRGGER